MDPTLTPRRAVMSLIHEVRALKDRIPEDATVRRQLSDAIHELSLALETPLETVRRISFSSLQITIARVANDLNIFQLLSEHDSSLSIDDISFATKAEKSLLTRILRYLAAIGLIDACSAVSFKANGITKALSKLGFKAGVDHHFDAQLPSWLALPSFLASTGYKDPTDPGCTAFQVAHNTTLPAFEWAIAQPRVMRDFGMWMSVQRAGQKSWLDVFPLENLRNCEGNPDAPLFVDIGGGVGHQCLALQAQIPDEKRRIIVQDLPAVLARSEPTRGIEQVPFDLWTEQPVGDASFYYLRNILHDYPDAACITLLRNTRSVMSDQSVILIDEIVLPEVGLGVQAAQLDISMMASLAGRERSRADWREIVEAAELRIDDVLTYEEDLGESVIVAVVP